MDKRPATRSEPEPIRQVVGFQVAGVADSPASPARRPGPRKDQSGSESSLHQPLVTIPPSLQATQRDASAGRLSTGAGDLSEVTLRAGSFSNDGPSTPTMIRTTPAALPGGQVQGAKESHLQQSSRKSTDSTASAARKSTESPRPISPTGTSRPARQSRTSVDRPTQTEESALSPRQSPESPSTVPEAPVSHPRQAAPTGRTSPTAPKGTEGDKATGGTRIEAGAGKAGAGEARAEAQGEGAKGGSKEKGAGKGAREAPPGMPSKADLAKMSKAERRAIQEAQRAAKQEQRATARAQGDGGQAGKSRDARQGSSAAAESSRPPQRSPAPGDAEPSRRGQRGGAKDRSTVDLFAHLDQPDPTLVQRLVLSRDPQVDPWIHPHWLKMARETAELEVVGGDARCVALLRAFSELIRDYEPPADPSRQLGKDLLQRINKHVDFLLKFRPQAAAMGNATRFIKIQVGKLPQDAASDWPTHRDMLLARLESFLHERVEQAAEDAALNACDKVVDGDVVLCYCYSQLVARSILEAKAQGKHFSVVVVDSRPRVDGQRMLKEFTSAGISCQYTDVTALSYIMREATKVFIGASAVLANGSVYARAGSAIVALVAQSFQVPVIVLAETNKFHERVQLDAITTNELFNPKDLLSFDYFGPSGKDLEGVENTRNLKLLNLNYDLIPADLVTVVATEAGLVPPSSVPVILREYRKDLHADFGVA